MKVEQNQNLEEAKVVKFSEEAKEILDGMGARILTVGGVSLSELRKSGFRIRASEWPELLNEKPPATEVAIWTNPEEFWVQGSFYKQPDEIKRLQGEFDRFVRARVPGAKAIIGFCALWSQIAFKVLEQDGLLIFGKSYQSKSTLATETYTGTQKAESIFGHFIEELGPSAVVWDGQPRFSVGLAKLVGPADGNELLT